MEIVLMIALLTLLLSLLGFFVSIIFDLNVEDYFVKFILSIMVLICIMLITISIKFIV